MSLAVATAYAQTSAVTATNVTATVTASTTVPTTAATRAAARLSAAQAAAQAKLQAQTQKAISRGISLGDQEITRRITALNQLLTRIAQMKKVSASEQAVIAGQVQGQIATMTALKTEIDADTSTTTLKASVQSITVSYRIFALILPQVEILAASDRVGTIVDAMTVLEPKLAAAITTAQTAGKDVTPLQATLADYNAKVSDAGAQYVNAGNTVAVLVPDNGDTTVAASNEAALKAARADIKTATADLVAARKDAATIVTALKEFHISTSTSASAECDDDCCYNYRKRFDFGFKLTR